MQNPTPIELLRGRQDDGGFPNYTAFDFLAAKSRLAFGSPALAAHSARNSVAQNVSFFQGFVSPEQADTDAGVPSGRAAAALEAFKEAGLGDGLFANYGNPGGLTLFFPEIRVSDYNHPESPRTCAFRWEQADDALRSPGVALARMFYRLKAEGVDIEAPFVRQTVE